MERQRDHEKALRHQLDKLLAQARENEKKLARIQAQEFRLIGADSLGEILSILLRDLRAGFGLEAVTLALRDFDGSLVELMEHGEIQLDLLPGLMILDSDLLERGVDTGPLRPRLGRFEAAKHKRFFPSGPDPASVALLPLVRGRKLIGSLHLGSANRNRFTPDRATDFLQRLAAIAAVCIENSVNRERLRQLGLTDSLTGVNNRRYFDERLAEELSAAERRSRPLACMILDVDHFKQINDGYGHPAGDSVLQELAGLLRQELRRNDVLCRYGGEEFVILMPETSGGVAGEIAERIRAKVEGHCFAAEDEPLKVTISIGIADLASCAEPDQLLSAADAALYEAKSGGRNAVVIHRLD